VARLLPSIVVVSIAGLIAGDYDTGAAGTSLVPMYLQRMLVTWAFVLNYMPSKYYGSFTLSPCWSCCVDLQTGTFIYSILMWFKSHYKPDLRAVSDTVSGSSPRGNITGPATATATVATYIAQVSRWIFLLLIILCVIIRAVIFDKDTLNMVRFGNYNHFGLLVAGDAFSWIEKRYNHVWLTTNSAAHLATNFVDRLIYPAHTRFGTMAVGAFLACQVFLAHQLKYSRNQERNFGETICSMGKQVICIVLTGIAIAQLLLPCFSDASVKKSVSVEAELAITASLQTISACSVSFLLFRALAPVDHPWHWPILARFLSLHVWRPIATLSYCSYLIHFRLMFEINFNANYRNFLVLWGGESMPQTGEGYITYMHRLFLATFVLSIILSWVVHFLVEEPVCRWANSWLKPTVNPRSKRKAA